VPLSFEININNIFTKVDKFDKELVGIKAFDFKYEFSLSFKSKNVAYKITKDKISFQNEYTNLKKEKGEFVPIEGTSVKGRSVISKKNGNVEVYLDFPDEIPLKEEEKHISLWEEETLPNALLLERTLPFQGMPQFEIIFKDISVYDINSKLSKKGCPFTGKADLEEDGSNLAIVLNRLLKDKAQYNKFYNLVNDILPFVKEVDTEKFVWMKTKVMN